MHVFVARQPIFDRKNNVVAYELLFRNGYENSYNSVDGNKATLSVIANSFYEFDFKTITDNKKVFINFTEKLIKDEIATILSPEYVVIEILETIEPTDEIINECKKLKEKGFTLALDDFVFHEKYNKLIEIIDIIKVDFLITKNFERKKILDLLKINNKIRFLAEKVESMEEYNEAVNLGYTYFQGYYFSKPVILETEYIPSSRNTALEILKLVNNKDFSFNDLEALILKDVGLSYKLTKLIKSSTYCIKNKDYSIKNAIIFLGEKEIIKWLYVVLLNDLKGDNPNELIKVSLQRAKFCELICNMSIYKDKALLAYMTGLFSVMDAILNCSMKSIIKEIYLYDEIKDALIGKENELNNILKLAVSFDMGGWKDAEVYADKINIDINRISVIYLDALKWVDDIQLD
ncbi:EAL domain-containing protein [Clostridium sp.]|uniref:EAL and HDOD domain-containing protein n=1 Tax=Clostridium sp. TaxID=1506 RepID=UPI00284FA776|nr:EAL domain-containing protein [Clostridium sp.]MDR3593211.1 EAL domain-containing protein [Clostridium sp.]